MSRLSYEGKVILAPMVRLGTLPLRLQALEYGADIVYTEEIVDKKMIRTKRVVNEILGTVDFIDEGDGSVVFRTCCAERQKVVFQVGTSDAALALQVAKIVENDVAGFDVNMGCPKAFSLTGGMGAALLTQPNKVKEILCSLVENLTIPVTCKIRLLPSVEETLTLCKLIESCGVAALAVHGRTKDERPQHPNNNTAITRIVQELSIPVIANGGSKTIETYEDALRFRKETGASSVMIARAAQWNCSVFRQAGKLPIDEVITTYLKYAINYDNVFSNTKYCVQNMLRELQESSNGKSLLHAKSVEEIYQLWGLGDYYEQKRSHFMILSEQLKTSLPSSGHLEPSSKKSKIEASFFSQVCDDPNVIKILLPLKKPYEKHILPKTELLNHCTRSKHNQNPIYRTEPVDKLFFSTVTVQGQTYANRYMEKNKKSSEQAAAFACLSALNLLPPENRERNSPCAESK